MVIRMNFRIALNTEKLFTKADNHKPNLLLELSIGNIQENIVFNRPLDEDKLKRCIESCYLKKVGIKYTLSSFT